MPSRPVGYDGKHLVNKVTISESSMALRTTHKCPYRVCFNHQMAPQFFSQNHLLHSLPGRPIRGAGQAETCYSPWSSFGGLTAPASKHLPRGFVRLVTVPAPGDRRACSCLHGHTWRPGPPKHRLISSVFVSWFCVDSAFRHWRALSIVCDGAQSIYAFTHIAKQIPSLLKLFKLAVPKPATALLLVPATFPTRNKGAHEFAALREQALLCIFEHDRTCQLLSKGSKNAQFILQLDCHQPDVKFLSQLFAYQLITVKFYFF